MRERETERDRETMVSSHVADMVEHTPGVALGMHLVLNVRRCCQSAV